MNPFDAFEMISTRRDGRILTITLDRPDHLNVVNGELHAELARIFVEARRDDQSDVVVLTGAGRAFCAGGDLDWMQSAIDKPEMFEEVAREAKEIAFSQLDLDKPLICRLNGDAAGLGASLALLCDIVIASDVARISDPHVRIGLVAGDGGAFIWPQLVGYAKARLHLFTGEPLSAAEAERIGLISSVVSPEALDEACYGLAARLAASPRKALRWTKVAVNLPLKALLHAHFDAGVAYEISSSRSEDHREAVAAFRQKRKPIFTGR